MHAAYLLNLASPETSSRTPSESGYQVRKKPKSRYANSMSQPFTQMVRPAYEFMSDVAPLGDIRYAHHAYSTPHSPPQSPPEIVPRPRARPYLSFADLFNCPVVAALGKLRGVMKIPNLGLSSLIGHVTRTTNHVLRTRKWAGAINVGAIRGKNLTILD